ncbi:MAG: hypothetical protein Q9162_003352 [Coniocarpon cinnabarinum]
MPICIEHDVKQLKARRCGFRKLEQERKIILEGQNLRRAGRDESYALKDAKSRVFLSRWQPVVAEMEFADQRRREERKWAPEDRGIDPSEDLESPVESMNRTLPNLYELRRTKSLTILPSQSGSLHTGAGSDAAISTSIQSSNSRWLGCGAYLCPSPRGLGDPRPRCKATETSNAPTTTSSPNQAVGNAASTVTNATNLAAHVAHHHPQALPFIANLNLSNLTLQPGTTLTFLYGTGSAPNQPLQQAQTPADQQGLQFVQVVPGQPNPDATTSNLDGNVQPPNALAANHQVSAIITHAAGSQQHVRGGVIQTASQNEHEALRCAACSTLVCADCRREHPCCPCSACSPTLFSTPTYAQAATATTGNPAASSLTATQNANVSTGSQTVQAAAGSSSVNTTSTPGIQSLSAQQLCPNCRCHPSVQSRCRYAAESSKALELLQISSRSSTSKRLNASANAGASDGPNDEDAVGSVIEDGSWNDFWGVLEGERVIEGAATVDAPAAVTLAANSTAIPNHADPAPTIGVVHGNSEPTLNHTTPSPPPQNGEPAPQVMIAPAEDEPDFEHDSEDEADVSQVHSHMDNEEDMGETSSVEMGEDGVMLEEEVMGMEG